MPVNLNSKNARTEFKFIEIEVRDQKFAVVKVNLNKTKTGIDIIKIFCSALGGECDGHIAIIEMPWTEKNEFRLREFAILCGLSEPRKDIDGNVYDHATVDYPGDYVGGVFVADGENKAENGNKPYIVLKNIRRAG